MKKDEQKDNHTVTQAFVQVLSTLAFYSNKRLVLALEQI